MHKFHFKTERFDCYPRSQSQWVNVRVCVFNRLSFPLHSGKRPVPSLSLSLSRIHIRVPNPKPLIFLAVSPLPGREPSLSLSAGMKARVEMLARLHPHAIYGHTKAWDERGRRSQIKGSHGSAHWPHLRLLYKDLPPTPNLFSRKPQKHFPMFFFPLLVFWYTEGGLLEFIWFCTFESCKQIL